MIRQPFLRVKSANHGRDRCERIFQDKAANPISSGDRGRVSVDLLELSKGTDCRSTPKGMTIKNDMSPWKPLKSILQCVSIILDNAGLGRPSGGRFPV